MGRKKLQLELITNQKKRNMAYLNRKSGIIKKARELKTLCDVKVCVIISPPSDHDHQEPPEIFPADSQEEVKGMIEVYKQYQYGGGKVQICGLSDFLEDRKNKLEAEVAKAKKKNLEAKYPTWFDFLNNFSEDQLRVCASWLQNKIDHVKTQIESLKAVNQIDDFLVDVDQYYSFGPGVIKDGCSSNSVPDQLSSGSTDSMMMLPMSDELREAFKQIDDFLVPVDEYYSFDLVKDCNDGYSSNPIPTGPMMMLLMSEEDKAFDDNFILGPTPTEHCYEATTLQQQVQPFMHYSSMMLPDDHLLANASKVMEKGEMVW